MPDDGYFSALRDRVAVEAGGCFCHACLTGKPSPEQSPDTRYCQQCFEFLLKEAALLDGRKPSWIPRDRAPDATESTPDNVSQRQKGVSKLISISPEGHRILKQKRGRKKKIGTVSRVTNWRRRKEGKLQGVLL